jgi:excisionase family DNA binding protein
MIQALVRTRVIQLQEPSFPQDRDELLAVPEVAGLLKLKPPFVYELIRQGRLPAVAVGKYRRVPRSALTAWLQKNTSNYRA